MRWTQLICGLMALALASGCGADSASNAQLQGNAGSVGQGGQSTNDTAGTAGTAGNAAGTANGAGGSGNQPPPDQQDPSAGSGGATDAGAMADSSLPEGVAPEGGAADAASCDLSCVPPDFGPSIYCTGSDVEWLCNSADDLETFNENCESVPINSIRYCCPATFLSHCQ